MTLQPYHIFGELKKWMRLKFGMIVAEVEPPYFREREIWWCSLGMNIGFEQNGKNDFFERPVLILKKFNKDMLWILPLTSAEKDGSYYMALSSNQVASSVILSQIRTISSRRLLRMIRRIAQPEFKEIQRHIIEILTTNAST